MSEDIPAEPCEPEFSSAVTLDSLPRGGKHFVLSADDDERKAVAHRLGVPAIARLDGHVQLRATNARIFVKGRIDAALTRECVASLEAMDEAIGEEFEIEFLRHNPAPTQAGPKEDESEEDRLNAPDIHDAPALDLGELLVQQLSLAMDPFPRLPNATNLVDQFGVVETLSPFAEALGKAVKSEENQ